MSQAWCELPSSLCLALSFPWMFMLTKLPPHPLSPPPAVLVQLDTWLSPNHSRTQARTLAKYYHNNIMLMLKNKSAFVCLPSRAAQLTARRWGFPPADWWQWSSPLRNPSALGCGAPRTPAETQQHLSQPNVSHKWYIHTHTEIPSAVFC